MQDWIILFVLVFSIATIILLIYLIPTLKQLRKTAAAAEKALSDLDRELIPLIQQTKKTMEEVNRITVEISQMTAGLREQLSLFETVIANFRSIAERAQLISSLVYDQVETPIINVLNNINAFKQGFSTFVNMLLTRRKGG
jgi:uncharacterized protein YoxC